MGHVANETFIDENEDKKEAAYRIYSVLSYFFVLVIIGVPVWWYTTRVYRATLPLEQMYNLKIEAKAEKHLGIPLSLEYDILITIVNPDPEHLELDVDGSEIGANLTPFLDSISHVANFTVKSQWLYLVELGVIPKNINGDNAIFEEQLPHIITPLEKNLWSHLSSRPCLNLVLYVPHCSTPLVIYSKDSTKIGVNALVSPNWGGIFILNADKNACSSKYFKPHLKEIIPTFITQLSKLFNLDGRNMEERISNLKEIKVNNMIESSKRTLKSLSQLLSEINSIVISDDVALKINIALENLNQAEHFLHNNIDKALGYAKIAFKNSEDAFSDPSLLALLYFPDDQKYAVYIPLFLPIMIPVLMSLTTIKKRWNMLFGKLKKD